MTGTILKPATKQKKQHSPRSIEYDDDDDDVTIYNEAPHDSNNANSR